MANPSGSFIWYELMTTDSDAAAAFYGAVVGWTFGEPVSTDQSGPVDYRMIVRSDGGFAGGVLRLTEEMTAGGARPAWMGYLYSPDVDATVSAIVNEGGRLYMPAFDITVGRIAMVADPQGAPIYVMTPVAPDSQEGMQSDVFDQEKPQHVRWNELMSADPEASIAFYKKHFGIDHEGDMDMGEFGKYRFIQHHGVPIGAIMPLMPKMSMSVWNFYIGVDDIDRASAAVESGSGKIVNGPMEIPGGQFALNGMDPQGAAFGLVGPRQR
ncbi:MAG: VOC family protein [Gammaproteobacteria bacterium]|nr:VOC family protein [Gammaproteobacteria bacterium]